MDKFFWYVLGTYVATFGVLVGYLAWMWQRARGVQGEDVREAPR
ncbi:hypothetical protein [Deinococcus radiotolerans]|uniref:Heme exporter protein D n=1 Tax=Deinococcus radiotolerans TaxID=1309407 RepID=A0ABQ2FGX0_9DEIO|nr:hypothetical protein [Deinococcus radiotolerans]GGK93341.1 hypothetical protein GCM10010844_09800 [Deinococcus radiotolerans]